MLALKQKYCTPRNKLESFLSKTPVQVAGELVWEIRARTHAAGVHYWRGEGYLFSVHNLTPFQARRAVKKFERGAEYDIDSPVHCEMYRR